MKITTLFCDVGGVLLTNGWDRHSREKAADQFHYDYQEVESRHQLMFENFEVGKISLDHYLEVVVFFKKRSFSLEEYRQFMFNQSQPHHDMMELIRHFKHQQRLKVTIISNEGRELINERLRKFDLRSIGDVFMVSCFIKMRKPDLDVFRMALDLAQEPPEKILYIDDRELFVEIAKKMGINAIHHQNHDQTAKELQAYM